MQLLEYELSRTFRTADGAIVSTIDIGNGQTAVATLYVATLSDPTATLTSEIARLRSDAAAVHEKLQAMGMA